MTTQVKISQAQKDAIKRIRKAQDKALAGKIGDETIMIDLDCCYHHWNSCVKPCICASFSIWHDGEMSQLYYDLNADTCSLNGSDDEDITYDEFFETVSKHLGITI